MEINIAVLNEEEETGRLYPHEFISTLADTCGDLVDNWLKSHNAPAEIINLLDHTIMLERCAQGARHDHLDKVDAWFLAQEIPQITRLIIEQGGTFRGPAGATPPRV